MRLFIAIEMEEALKMELARLQHRLEPYSDSLKLTAANQLHLTLRFLGDTEGSLVEQIKGLMSEVASRHKALDLTLAECGCFPAQGNPRILWAGIWEQTGGLLKLQQELEAAMEELGFQKEDRPFSPHLTLARVRKNLHPQGLRETVGALKTTRLSQRADSISLIQSILKPSGAEYTTVFRAGLEGRDLEGGPPGPR